MNLDQYDAWAIARALTGQEVPEDLHISAATKIALRLIQEHKLDFENVRDVLGDNFQQIMEVDPSEEPPTPDKEQKYDEMVLVPELPKNARVKEDIATESGGWFRDYVEWASKLANQTPRNFHMAAALWLGALPIGRRLKIKLDWGFSSLYAADYHMSIAVSTYFRKSTGFRIAEEIVKDHLPHLVLAQPGSPEAFLEMLAGRMPNNWEDLPEAHKRRLKAGRKFAAARGLVRDEISALFKAMSRDYMAGLKEMLMALWDSPSYLDQHTKSGGLLIVENVAMSIIGATTPAELAFSINEGDWHNGNLARFCLWTPEEDYQELPPSEYFEPQHIINPWLKLYKSLPEPVEPPQEGISEDPDREKPEEWTISLTREANEAMRSYERALRGFCAPGSGLDERLNPNYGRFHEHALKFALTAAAYRWVEGTEKYPKVNLADWYFAQSITEELRTSTHRVLAELGRSSDAILEDQIVSALKRSSGGATIRDLYRGIPGTNRRKVEEAVKAMLDDGLAEEFAKEGQTGRPTSYYKLATNG